MAKKEDKLKKVKQIETPIPKEIRKKLITDLQSITIDFESSLKCIDDTITDNRRKYLKNLIMINKIRDNDIYWKFDKHSRFHSNFTNLKKDIRKKYLRIDYEPVCEIDIPTSQPFFLSQILKQERLINNNEEVKKFINIVENEDIYIYFLEKHPSIFKDRDAVKPMIYKCLFKRYKKLNEYHELFRSEFPFIFDYLESYYVNNGEPLWKTLQRMESYFIFNIVYPEIIARFKDINLYYSQTQNSTKADAFGIGEQKIVFREGDMIVGFPA